MISIEPITRENALVFRITRRRAIQDTTPLSDRHTRTCSNQAQGFSFTGRTVPYPNDPDRSEYEVAWRL